MTTLGRCPQLSLRGAREKLSALDPNAALQTLTLGELLRLWYADDVRGRHRRPHHVQGYLDRLEATEAVLEAARLRDLEHVLVFQALKRYARSRGPIDPRQRLSEVVARTALRRTMIYELQAVGRFPYRVRLEERAVGWVESDVENGLAQRVQASRRSI